MLTPHENYPELASAIGVSTIYLKREDLNHYGSHKGRSIPFMIDHYYKIGDRKFVISSSGNAALAAVIHIQEINKNISEPVEIEVYISHRIPTYKQEKLEAYASPHIRIMIKEHPLHALTQAVQEGYRSLRQSVDDIALTGYSSLAEELISIKDIGAIFIGTSSGTTAQALAQYMLKTKTSAQVHLIQTSSCHPLVDAFESSDTPDEISIADAIVDHNAYRAPALIPLIQKTGGRGWTASNDDIHAAQELAEKYANLPVSTNSALSIVGAMKAVEIGYDIEGIIVCIICGD